MTDAPGSPRAARLATPSWLDTRLVLGVLLVLVSVVIGARVLSAADRSQLVWTTSRALSPGTPLTSEDVVATPVRLFGNADRYLSAEQPAPVGYVLSRALGADELLPRDALAAPGREADVREVTVNVRPGSAPPDLRRGELVDVYVTPERRPGADNGSAASAPTAPGPSAGPAAATTGARLVLSGVTVLQVPAEQGFGAGSEQRAVVLQVRPDAVATVLTATELGRIDLVRVPAGVTPTPTAVAGAG